MTQPQYVPVKNGSSLRKFDSLALPKSWKLNRPAELSVNKHSAVEQGKNLGTPGPDSGFAMKLARVALEGVADSSGLSAADIKAAVVAVTIARASLFSRAPVMNDVRFAIASLGIGNDGLNDHEVEVRNHLVRGISHDYMKARDLVGRFGVETLKLNFDKVTPQAIFS
ncbi:MAG: hypothetical protein M0019_08195 [Actinomycetota bacterium]|nr:hypothetical protein [Actinomycetota bacterium]